MIRAAYVGLGLMLAAAILLMESEAAAIDEDTLDKTMRAHRVLLETVAQVPK